MEWLHFSDFHFGRDNPAQEEAMGCLLDFIRDDLQANPAQIDAVFLVGDIAYSGAAEDYVEFETMFLKPLIKLPQLSKAEIYAVPGNHDVDCDASNPITWSGIKERNQLVYFSEDDIGRKAREQRAAIFHNYQDFATRNGIIGPVPSQEVSILTVKQEFPFDILSVNTSFFCDKDDTSDAPITPCPLISLRKRTHGSTRQRPLFVLGHHPIGCFLKDQQKPFETFLIEQKAVYLHGHAHEPSVTHNSDGTVRTLGFGATYVSSMGTASRAPYQNSYARCRLHDSVSLRSFIWDNHVGRWDESTRSQFSSSFRAESTSDRSLTLNIPLLVAAPTATQPNPNLDQLPRRTPTPSSIVPVSVPGSDVWMKLVALSTNLRARYTDERAYTIQSTTNVGAKIEIVTEVEETRDLLVCIPGSTHILSAKEIESYNTRLDTEDFKYVTILSLGKMSGEAREMYLRLQSRKPIEALVNKELTSEWNKLLSHKQCEAVASRDAAATRTNILVSDDDIYLLLEHATGPSSFQIVDAAGTLLPPSHEVVAALRDVDPTYSKMGYDTQPGAAAEMFKELAFDESVYLTKCYAEYNAVKYAALANIGIRFSDFSLEDLYIDGSACEIDDAQSAERLDAMLEDHLAAYPASEKLKTQIKQRLLQQVEQQDRHETSQAREFCQKYGAVLLTGDPGSGKTCFVKSEVLAYARRAVDSSNRKGDSEDWHSAHLPVFVSLSQAAAEPDLEQLGLIKIAARLVQRHGLHIPANTLGENLKRGRLALFFDGLDEVVSVEKRALVVQHINDIVRTYLPLGNRIVVTSRPAAINVVNLLPSLRHLELQGLSESEIRTLANRIVSLGLADPGTGVVIQEKPIGQSDAAIVSQLIDDCRQKPGVGRFATNPLLLTLLVMIYANSGALSAKRHRIYEEAIKTLAAVRGRQAGHSPVSVQDLREKLGAVALSVYRKESGILPTQTEVVEVVRSVMAKQRGDPPLADAQRFVQKVAESTGLIAFGGTDGGQGGFGVVTFMHHSFMEYFAAVGLSRELDTCDVATLVTQPRWVEILTLLAGVVGEREDITPVLARFIDDGSHYGDVDARHLLFALDCALECEVPSEAAVGLLSTSLTNCVEHGPAKSDPWVRAEIGGRLAQLIASCGAQGFECALTSLIQHTNPDIAAAGVSITGYALADEPELQTVRIAIDASCKRTEENVVCAICHVASMVPWARTPPVWEVAKRCFRKTARAKRAAFELVLAVPGTARDHWSEIINALDDDDAAVRRLASKVAIRAGLDTDIAALNDSRKDLVAEALRYVHDSSAQEDYRPDTVRDETVSRLMRSGYLRDRLIGIHLLPAAEGGADHAYKTLMSVLHDSEDHRELTAALYSLRSSPEARLQLSSNDIKHLATLSSEGTSNVREAAISLLGYFGWHTIAVRALIERANAAPSGPDFCRLFAALGRAQVLRQEVLDLIQSELMTRFRDTARFGRTNVEELCAVLDSARVLGSNMRGDISGHIRDLAKDFRRPDRVRGSALLTYSATASPSKHVVEFLTGLFASNPVSVLTELVQTLGMFAKNCRQTVDYVMACVESLSGLQEAARTLHNRLANREVSKETEYLVTELRDGIGEISQIVVTFEEFIRPVSTDGDDQNPQQEIHL